MIHEHVVHSADGQSLLLKHDHELAPEDLTGLHHDHTDESGKWTQLSVWGADSGVQDLVKQLNSLAEKISGYEEAMAPIMAAMSQAQAAKDDFLASVKLKLAEYDKEIYQANMLKATIETDLANAKVMKSQVGSALTDTLAGLQAKQDIAEAESKWQALKDEHDWFWKEYIRNFQWVGARFMAGTFDEDLHGRLNADQMGLGKTLQATAALDMMQANSQSLAEGRILWVCPNSIKHTTWLEINKWSPERKITVLEKAAPEVRDMMVKIAYEHKLTLIVNYEALNSTPSIMAEEYHYNGKQSGKNLVIDKPREWDIVVLDEAHAFKNENSLTFQWVEVLAENSQVILPMTGTPILNKPDEFWAILHMLTKRGKYVGRFEHKWRFIQDYCWQYGSKTSFKSTAHIDKLMKQVSDLVIRRKKDEVEIELPDKVREVRFVELGSEQRAVYDMMRDQFIVWLDSQKKDAITATNLLSQLTRLRQIALYPAGVKIPVLSEDGEEISHKHLDCQDSAKLDEAMEIIRELMDNGEKVLVFSSYNEPLMELERRIKEQIQTYTPQDSADERRIDTARIMGGVNEVKRADSVLKFNDPTDDVRVMLGNIKAMGLGLNLQGACSHAIFLDLWWNPGINEQAEDRLHRQGQKNSVTIHIIQAEETVDAFIAKKIEEKLDLIESVIERAELRKAIDEGLI